MFQDNFQYTDVKTKKEDKQKNKYININQNLSTMTT